MTRLAATCSKSVVGLKSDPQYPVGIFLQVGFQPDKLVGLQSDPQYPDGFFL